VAFAIPHLHSGPAACVFASIHPITLSKQGTVDYSQSYHIMPASSPVVPVSITCRAGKAGAAASRGIVTGSRSMIRLACSSPTAWETVFHILFSILPLPFCIVLCVFQSTLSLDRLGRLVDCFWTSSRGLLEFVNLVDHTTLSPQGAC
jgi:hypothetical protein